MLPRFTTWESDRVGMKLGRHLEKVLLLRSEKVPLLFNFQYPEESLWSGDI